MKTAIAKTTKTAKTATTMTAKAAPAAQAKAEPEITMIPVARTANVTRTVRGNLFKADFNPAYVDRRTGEVRARLLLGIVENGTEYYMPVYDEYAKKLAESGALKFRTWAELTGIQGNPGYYTVAGNKVNTMWFRDGNQTVAWYTGNQLNRVRNEMHIG